MMIHSGQEYSFLMQQHMHRLLSLDLFLCSYLAEFIQMDYTMCLFNIMSGCKRHSYEL